MKQKMQLQVLIDKTKRSVSMKTLKWIYVFVFILVFAFSFIACDNGTTSGNSGNNDDPALPGSINISVQGGGAAEVGCTLLAAYTGGGNETVAYQWQKNNSNILFETGTSLVADSVGDYTVTVSAAGFKSKTSSSLNVIHGTAGLYEAVYGEHNGDNKIDLTGYSNNWPGGGNDLLGKATAWISSFGQTDTQYTLIVDSSFTTQKNYLTPGKKLAIVGVGGMRTISYDGTESMFPNDGNTSVNSTICIGNNITLTVAEGSDASYIVNKYGGEFIMEGNAVITGSTRYSLVNIRSANFTMKGGEIKGNTITGGGVVIWDFSTLTMTGGSINGNFEDGGSGIRPADLLASGGVKIKLSGSAEIGAVTLDRSSYFETGGPWSGNIGILNLYDSDNAGSAVDAMTAFSNGKSILLGSSELIGDFISRFNDALGEGSFLGWNADEYKQDILPITGFYINNEGELVEGDGDGGDGDTLDKSGTFTAIIFSLNAADYNDVFGTEPTSFTILSGSSGELISKFGASGTKSSYSPLDGGMGLIWDQVEGKIQDGLVESGIITSTNKDTIMDTLGTKGYVAGVIDLGNGYIGIALAYRE